MFTYGKRFITNYHLRHMKSVFQYNIRKKTPIFPTIFQIQTINQCNFSCPMCPNSAIQQKKSEIMSEKLYQKIISEILQESPSIPMILLYLQNEPLLDEDMRKRIQFIKKKNSSKAITGLLSNGSLFTEQKIHELETTGIDFISISLDATTENTYNKVRGCFDFNIILKNIDNLLSSQINKNHIGVEFAIQKNNVKELKNFKKLWRKKVGGMVFNYLTNRSGDLSNFDDIALDEENLTFLEQWKYLLLKKIYNFCPLPFTAFHILSNGDVILCTEDYNKKLILGSVKDSSIKEIWCSKDYRELRDKIYKKRYLDIPLCKNCTRWRLGIF